jgi:hypothetical protein
MALSMAAIMGGERAAEARKPRLFTAAQRASVQALTKRARALRPPRPPARKVVQKSGRTRESRGITRREAARSYRMLGDSDLQMLLVAIEDKHPVILGERTHETHAREYAERGFPQGTRFRERLMVKSDGLYRDFEWTMPGQRQQSEIWEVAPLGGRGFWNSGPATLQAWGITPTIARDRVVSWLDQRAQRLPEDQRIGVRGRMASSSQ